MDVPRITAGVRIAAAHLRKLNAMRNHNEVVMANSTLARQVAELRKLVEARSVKSSEPVYLQAGTAAPEGLDQSRIVWIERVLIDPPEQPEEQLPEIVEPSPAIEKASPSFTRPLAEPELAIV